MSLLMFFLEPEQVLVLTDTLSTTETGDPHLHATKCALVPHLDMVAAFTGIADIGFKWSYLLQTRVLARDIDMLDKHVPDALLGVSAEVTDEYGRPLESTSTIYHLGYSEERGCYVGYVYRSKADFQSETMEPSFRIKPEPEGGFNRPDSLEEIIDLAVRVKREQDARPPAERISVGGELILTALSGRVTSVKKVYRFEDFESRWLAMNAALELDG